MSHATSPIQWHLLVFAWKIDNQADTIIALLLYCWLNKIIIDDSVHMTLDAAVVM